MRLFGWMKKKKAKHSEENHLLVIAGEARAQLYDLVDSKHVGKEAAEALQIFAGLEERHVRLLELIQKNLSPQEITYQRFKGSSNELYEKMVLRLRESAQVLGNLELRATAPNADLSKTFQEMQRALEVYDEALKTVASFADFGAAAGNRSSFDSALDDLSSMARRFQAPKE